MHRFLLQLIMCLRDRERTLHRASTFI
jgi:hypothetical protein